jgi:ETC complex I subunit conserved region
MPESTRARIFQRPKTATQSGTAGTADWMLHFEPGERERNDPLIGWWGNRDTKGQVRLRFDTREEAVAFAEQNGIAYDVEIPPRKHGIVPKSYADNFRYNRMENWTH